MAPGTARRPEPRQYGHHVAYAFDRYLRFAELTEVIHGYAAAHPDLVQVESYGTSHEGRNLWLVTVTDAVFVLLAPPLSVTVSVTV